MVNPLFILLAVPAYAAWSAYLAGRVLRKPDPRGDAIKEVEAQLEEVARTCFAETQPPAYSQEKADSAARVREQFEALMQTPVGERT